MPKIKDLPKIDLPREKLQKYGVNKLTDFELLAILLGSGIKGLNVLQLSKRILVIIRKIGINKITLEDLLKIKGLGKAKASQILSAMEIGGRLSKKREIFSSKDVWNLCIDIRDSKKEHFLAFYLDTQNHLIERQIISVGTLNSSLVYPREVFEPAIRLSAASIIIAHNHPSGKTEPSEQDLIITRKLIEAGKILGIELIDHVIVGANGYLSLREKLII